MNKGLETKQNITRQAMTMASRLGLEKLTIGNLAKEVGMSKSGLFAHFDSKETLQLKVMEEARDLFVQKVLNKALQEPRGEPRVRALFENWIQWVHSSYMPGGCIFIGAAAEYDDIPGPTRDFVATNQKQWFEFIQRAAQIAVEEGHFRQDLDPAQFTFEMLSLYLGYHHCSRLLKDPKAKSRIHAAFEGLLERSH